MTLELDPKVEAILVSLGDKAASFFLAAGLYHAQELSYAAAAQMAGLDFNSFGEKLGEHFGVGFILSDEVIEEDLEAIKSL